jgi:hypothetical protein
MEPRLLKRGSNNKDRTNVNEKKVKSSQKKKKKKKKKKKHVLKELVVAGRRQI